MRKRNRPEFPIGTSGLVDAGWKIARRTRYTIFWTDPRDSTAEYATLEAKRIQEQRDPDSVVIAFNKAQIFALRSILLAHMLNPEATRIWEDIISQQTTTIEEMLDLVHGRVNR